MTPWWLVNADTKRSRKFTGPDAYKQACAAGIRAYNRKKDQGFYAEDTFHIVSGGDWYSVAPMANTTTEQTP
jgi:hypothetical protein